MTMNKEKGEHKVEGKTTGRVPDAKKDQPLEQNELRDISEIDQQEGFMNNGTLGGNFDENSTTGSEMNLK